MGFMEAVRGCLRRYATFRGRARRSEMWWFVLYGVLLAIPANIAFLLLWSAAFEGSITGPAEDPAINPTAVSWGAFTAAIGVLLAYALLYTVPALAVQSRRLHDMGQPAWWLLLHLIGLGIVVLIMCAMRGQTGSNRHGPDPRLVPVPSRATA
ncbi:DUF805 domain-containing protein [Demequina lignilytica]|uniref:DUF805 domain-containing protein n=1 Tax=Demequina lignilytica TaxID=3051663 RepID=A0AAW7M0D9_9MICO|nr:MULTISPECIES: DUF805 domain-containing protein [unclassified Demequina]MDN4477829.1 DUF805 domain-containing protein [Demequina sp. SYSU T00039-1]MDN4483468.1 DUF805 domain-containing protein [Demequina sp. SYSU T0a273]MDN4487738.1 DUF805 domain-containing protein [Demequina sp. SYSU T00039]MDN4490879.1 DUF805 domain-containing protein [Demequina sp. SYSU T00068]